jgi:ribonuclease HI
MITLQFDGLFNECEQTAGIPKKAGFLCYGWIILQDEAVIARGHGGMARAHDATSNVAEYLALIEGLDALVDLGIHDNQSICIWGDAKCVIDQMRGASSVNSPTIIPFYRRACRLAQRFHAIVWIWRPRRENKTADWLTRHAMRQILADSEQYQAALKALDRTHSGTHANNKFHRLVDLRVYRPASSRAIFIPGTQRLPAAVTRDPGLSPVGQ